VADASTSLLYELVQQPAAAAVEWTDMTTVLSYAQLKNWYSWGFSSNEVVLIDRLTTMLLKCFRLAQENLRHSRAKAVRRSVLASAISTSYHTSSTS
jgi:hypothetical protein